MLSPQRTPSAETRLAAAQAAQLEIQQINKGALAMERKNDNYPTSPAESTLRATVETLGERTSALGVRYSVMEIQGGPARKPRRFQFILLHKGTDKQLRKVLCDELVGLFSTDKTNVKDAWKPFCAAGVHPWGEALVLVLRPGQAFERPLHLPVSGSLANDSFRSVQYVPYATLGTRFGLDGENCRLTHALHITRVARCLRGTQGQSERNHNGKGITACVRSQNLILHGSCCCLDRCGCCTGIHTSQHRAAICHWSSCKLFPDEVSG